MEDLIKALTILAKYAKDKYPTHCEHDVLYVRVDTASVPQEEIQTLEDLGFHLDEEQEVFCSFRYGSG